MVEPPSVVMQLAVALDLVLLTFAEEGTLGFVVFWRPVLFLALSRD